MTCPHIYKETRKNKKKNKDIITYAKLHRNKQQTF